MKKYFLVCNPGSKSFKSKETITIYKNLLQKDGVSFECGYTQKRYDGTMLTRKAIKDKYDVIVAVGGDGTINEVINGFFDENGNASDKLFGVLYSGTSPDFCKFHHIPYSPKEAVENLFKESVKKIDICSIQFKNYENEEITSYFGSSVNLGIGAGIAKRANKYRKYLGDYIGTFLATIITIVKHKPLQFSLNDKTQEEMVKNVWNITIGKNPFLASGLKLNIPITPDDGRLYLFSISNINRVSFLMLLPKIYRGTITKDNRFCLKMLSQIQIATSEILQEVEFDGDPAGWCPIKVTVKKQALNLIGAMR